VTVATGAADTVIADVPLFPSLVAVIVVLPATSAVMKPFADTLATAGWLDLHATRRPDSGLPFTSLMTAESCCVGVIPSTRPAVGGFTATLATGIGSTVMTGVATFGADSLAAVIIAVPMPAAVTVTVAPLAVLTELDALRARIAGLLEVQLTVRPKRFTPAPSFGVAVNCCVCPRSIGVVGAESVTAAIGTRVTVIVALPLLPSLVAMTLALPADTAVITPVPETVTTAGSLELQLTARPLNTPPFASSVVAVACAVPAAVREFEESATLTDATGIGTTVRATLTVNPPADALMFDEPGATAVTNPPAATVATSG
jgi:hypothetical protein